VTDNVFSEGLSGASMRQSVRPSTATDYVSDSLRRSILNGELRGGTKLSLATIASTFDVSTTPVREALRELSYEGLIRIDSYRGGTVTSVNREDVEEIIRIRQVLEPMAIKEAVQGMTAAILSDATSILEEMKDLATWDGWVQGNRAFHQKIYEAASSRRLVALIKSLQDTTVVFMSSKLRTLPALRETANDDHRQMLEAARAGDAEGLVVVTLRHLTIPISG
jgi:DNA-binding GntR family transcriptional regulator